MCIEYWRALERIEEASRSEPLEQQDQQAAIDPERSGSGKTGWALPADPVQACAGAPA